MVLITTNALKTATYFEKLAVEVPARVGAAVHRGAYQLQSEIRALAPVGTGRYRASIDVRGTSQSRFMYMAEIGSDLDYGYMLEFGGFTEGWDGQPVYHAPQPHFRPATSEFEPVFYASIEMVVV